MVYLIYDAMGEIVNSIVADEEFVNSYCEENSYTYEPGPEECETPESEPSYEPTMEEIMNALLGVTADE